MPHRSKFKEIVIIYKIVTLDNINGEAWRDVLGYDGIFSVSNMGRIKSERRYRMGGGIIHEKIRKQQVVNSNPHNLVGPSRSLHVTLAVDTVRITHGVATLVGNAFIGELKEGEVYSKKNKIWHDCRAENLEIKTVSDSHKLAYEKGNNRRFKKCLMENNVPKFMWTRLLDGKEFHSDELFGEYKKEVKSNILKGIRRNKQRYGSYWTRKPLRR